MRTRLGDDEGYAGTSGPAANANDLAARRRPGHHVVRFFGPRVGERDRVGPPAALAPDSVDPSPDRLTGRQLTAATIFSRLDRREVIPAFGARRFGSKSSGYSRRSMPASRILGDRQTSLHALGPDDVRMGITCLTLRQSGLRKVKAGMSTVEEVARETVK